jgi:hypothetical protein
MAPIKELTTNAHSAAWAFQVKVSFALSLTGMILGIVYLDVEPWARAFLAACALFTISSALGLAKTLRDEHESHRFVNRIDEAKLERFLAEHDPFKVS